MKVIRRTLLASLLLGSLAAWLGAVWLESSYEPSYGFVEDGLFIGKFVKQPPAGVKAVVNLCGYGDPYKAEVSLWEPVCEGGAEPSLEWLERVVEFIANQRQAGRKVFVHCLAGTNRSGAVVTAYLMHEHGWGRDQALAYLKQKRPVVQPNPALMRLLADWDNALQEKRTIGR